MVRGVAMETCRDDCAIFARRGDEGACLHNPIPRRGTCGRCDTAFVSKQLVLVDQSSKEAPHG